MTKKEPTIIPLRGNDSTGKVFLYNSLIIRGIAEGFSRYYRTILSLCQEHDLFRFGIVPTSIREGVSIPGEDFPLYLEHERIPFITYPGEWSGSMLKDAALFACDLNIALARYHLVLSDVHAYNILFKGPRPIQVDFNSVMFFDDLITLSRLKNLLRSFPVPLIQKSTNLSLIGVLYMMDFVPTFYRPLLLFASGNHHSCRILLTRSPNRPAIQVITAKDCSSIFPFSAILTAFTGLLLSFALMVDREPCKPRFWRILSRQVTRLEVRPDPSKIPDAAGSTMPCQLLEEAIRSCQPRTVLELYTGGVIASTAARLGCDVVAVDTDEERMDSLYLRAREENLSIIPLVIDPEVLLGDSYSNGPDPMTIFLPALQRLGCDMVIAGERALIPWGNSPERIAPVLDQLAQRYLLFLLPEEVAESLALHSTMKTALGSYFQVIRIEKNSDSRLKCYWCEKRSRGK